MTREEKKIVSVLCRASMQRDAARALGKSESWIYRMAKKPIALVARRIAAERLQRQQLKISKHSITWDVVRLNHELEAYSKLCGLWVLRTVAIDARSSQEAPSETPDLQKK